MDSSDLSSLLSFSISTDKLNTLLTTILDRINCLEIDNNIYKTKLNRLEKKIVRREGIETIEEGESDENVLKDSHVVSKLAELELQLFTLSIHPSVASSKDAVSWTLNEKIQLMEKVDSINRNIIISENDIKNNINDKYNNTLNSISDIENNIDNLKKEDMKILNICNNNDSNINILKEISQIPQVPLTLVNDISELNLKISQLKNENIEQKNEISKCIERSHELEKTIHSSDFDFDAEDTPGISRTINNAKVGTGARLASLERAMKIAGERLRNFSEVKASHVSKAAFDILRDEVTSISSFIAGNKPLPITIPINLDPKPKTPISTNISEPQPLTSLSDFSLSAQLQTNLNYVTRGEFSELAEKLEFLKMNVANGMYNAQFSSLNNQELRQIERPDEISYRPYNNYEIKPQDNGLLNPPINLNNLIQVQVANNSNTELSNYNSYINEPHQSRPSTSDSLNKHRPLSALPISQFANTVVSPPPKPENQNRPSTRDSTTVRPITSEKANFASNNDTYSVKVVTANESVIQRNPIIRDRERIEEKEEKFPEPTVIIPHVSNLIIPSVRASPEVYSKNLPSPRYFMPSNASEQPQHHVNYSSPMAYDNGFELEVRDWIGKFELLLHQQGQRMEILQSNIATCQSQLFGIGTLRQAATEFKVIVKKVEDELLKIQTDLLSTSGNRALASHINRLANDLIVVHDDLSKVSEEQIAIKYLIDKKYTNLENYVNERANPKTVASLGKQIENLRRDKANEVDLRNLRLFIVTLSGDESKNPEEVMDLVLKRSSLFNDSTAFNMLNSIVSQHSSDLINHKEWIHKNAGNIASLRDWMHHLRDKVTGVHSTIEEIQNSHATMNLNVIASNKNVDPNVLAIESNDANEYGGEDIGKLHEIKNEEISKEVELCRAELIKLKKEVLKKTSFADVERVMNTLLDTNIGSPRALDESPFLQTAKLPMHSRGSSKGTPGTKPRSFVNFPALNNIPNLASFTLPSMEVSFPPINDRNDTFEDSKSSARKNGKFEKAMTLKRDQNINNNQNANN